MPEDQYPVFEGGQTLTAADLNTMRTFLHTRGRLLGRIVGFGVGCGLRGVVSGTTLTIEPGLAVDQSGEPLVLPAAATIALAPTADATFDFVAADAGGFSVVLEATDTQEPAPDCGEADCEGHAALHTVGVALRAAEGRITGPRFDFAGEPLLDVEPMRLLKASRPQGSYVGLRNAIVKRLQNDGSPLIDPSLISALEGTSIPPGDVPGVRAYKAGFINQVLFATLELLRCRALTTVSCDRTTTRPGVVLGWVRLVGGTWTWECDYRHAWEPPPGLSQATVAGTCGTPCGIYVDLVEALIDGYSPPTPPAGGGGVGGGGGSIVFPHFPDGQILHHGSLNVVYPPPKIPDDWVDTFRVDPVGPAWYPPVDVYERFDDRVHRIYQDYGFAFFDRKVVTGTPALGHDAEVAVGALVDTITGIGGTANVVVLTQEQVAAVDGYEPAGLFNLADQVVMTADAQGTVVATGRVPAAHTARQVGLELPAARAQATEALDVAHAQEATVGTIDGTVGGLAVQVGELAGDVAAFQSFQTSTVQWQVTVDHEIGRVSAVAGEVVTKMLGATVDDIGRRVAKMEGTVEVLSRSRTGGAPVRPDARRRVDAAAALGLVDFASTVSAGLQALVTPGNERTLGRHVSQVSRAATRLSDLAGTSGEDAALGEATVALLGTLRTAVKSAGIDAALGRQLDTQLGEMRGLLG